MSSAADIDWGSSVERLAIALVTGQPLGRRHVGRLRSLGYTVINGSDEALSRLGVSDGRGRHLTEDELTALIPDVALYVYGGNEPATDRVLTAAEHLELIAFLGTGWDHPGCVDASSAERLGIRVTNTPHANARSTAEMTIGLMLALNRAIVPMAQSAREGEPLSIVGHDLHGQTVGIVGLGHVGSLVARALTNGFGTEVVYAGPSRKMALEDELGLTHLPLPDLVSRAEIVTIHTPPAATLGLLDAQLIGRIGPDALLVNTSVPEVVDGPSLVRALADGTLRAAAIDGAYTDREVQASLTAMTGRTIITPRAAWLTANSVERVLDMAFASISDLATAAPVLSHQVSPRLPDVR